MVLNTELLPAGGPRRFVSSQADLGDWTQASHYFSALEIRPIGSTRELESWLEDYSELGGVLSEAGATRYIRMTEQTDNEAYKTDHLSFVETVSPKAKLAQHRLDKKLSESPSTLQLPEAKYRMVLMRVRNGIRLFREENVELEKEDQKLCQKYESLTGAMTVSFEGKERTMSEMARYQEHQDRGKREDAWRNTQARRLRDRERIDAIYTEMVSIRDRIARNAGFDNYRDYSFLKRERFDYTPADCVRFHEAVERHIVPLARKVQERRREMMKLDVVRPWDLVVDAAGRPPLSPFATTDEFIRKASMTLGAVDPIFAKNFQTMVALNLFDLAARPGKAPGGYCAELSDHIFPFTFMNSVGRDQDMWTLLHESGHAFHVFEMKRSGLPYLYRGDNLPSEMAEVASMSMELLAGEHIRDAFYSERDAARSRYDHFRSIADLLPWVATIDAFQHWVYTHPGHTLEERKDAWVATESRFSVGESWDGLEDIRRSQWHRQLHIFLIPFYYFEYGVAQLGAMGVWSRYRRDPVGAVEAYRNALSLGSSRPLPELFAEAGLPWDFGESVVEKCADELEKILLD